MTALLIYILISLSFSYMWSFSEIFRPVRNFVAKIPIIKKPMLCPECASFWFGVFVYLFVLDPFVIHTGLISSVIFGLIVHLCASILYKKIL